LAIQLFDSKNSDDPSTNFFDEKSMTAEHKAEAMKLAREILERIQAKKK
jgi:hypothetical protein